MESLEFRRSSYSGSQGNCVEIADADTFHAIRDSKTPRQDPLAFQHTEWAAFLRTAEA
jgi:hypothetical protein